MKDALLFICFITLYFFGCTPTTETEPQGPVISPEISEAVVNHHVNAFLENDINAILEDYSEESVVVTPDSIYIGLDQIRSMFEGLFPSFPAGSSQIELDKMVTKNELVYVLWHGSTPVVDVPFGTDTFIVEDSTIVRQTFAGIINPVEMEAEEED